MAIQQKNVPTLLQKPIRNITEITDEPRLDIKKVRRLTGEMAKIDRSPRMTAGRVVAEFYYDLLFFLGAFGKHEHGSKETNRTALLVSLVVIPFVVAVSYSSTLYKQAYVDHSLYSSPPRSLSETTAPVQVAADGNGASIAPPSSSGGAGAGSGAGTESGTYAESNQTAATTDSSNLADSSEGMSPQDEVNVSHSGHDDQVTGGESKAVGAGQMKIDGGYKSDRLRRGEATYETAEDFWRAHPDYSRSEYIKAFGQVPPQAVQDYWKKKGRPIAF